MTTITVCTTCWQPELREAKEGTPCGESLLAAVASAAEAAEEITVRGTACLMGCEHGCNIAISDDGKLTYVLGRFTPEVDAAEGIVAYARGHAASASGAVPFREWPQAVKGHFVARVPPLAPLPPKLD